MNIMIETIIKCYIRIAYLFGMNLSKDKKTTLINYLTEAYNTILEPNIVSFLIANDFNLQDTNMYLRRAQFQRMIKEPDANILETSIVLIVSEELKKLNKIDLKNEGLGMSILACRDKLIAACKAQHVVAYFILGVSYYLGLFGKVNQELGNKYLVKIAKWNCLDALIVLSYNYKQQNNDIESYYYQSLVNTLYNDTYKINNVVVKNSEVEKRISDDIKIYELLSNERCNKHFDAEFYNPVIADILFCPKFSLFEKRTWIYSKKDIDWDVISNLITADSPKEYKMIETTFRKEEKTKLFKRIVSATKQKRNRPIIIKCRDDLVLNEYESFVSNVLNDYTLLKIDILTFDQQQLIRTNTKCNFLYQAIKKNRTSKIAIMMSNAQAIKSNVASEYYTFLMPEQDYYFYDIEAVYQKDYLLNFIFTTDIKGLDEKIVSASTILNLADVVEDEKEYLITYLLTSSLGEVKYNQAIIAKLVNIMLTVDYKNVKTIIKTFASQVIDKKDLTTELLESVIKETNIDKVNKIGFSRRIG